MYRALAVSQCEDDHNPMQLELVDSWGDGWDDDTLTISDCEGNVLNGPHTIESGSGHTVDICLPVSDGYAVTVTGDGPYLGEISWTLTNADGDVVLQGVEGDGVGEFSTCPGTRSTQAPIWIHTCTRREHTLTRTRTRHYIDHTNTL